MGVYQLLLSSSQLYWGPYLPRWFHRVVVFGGSLISTRYMSLISTSYRSLSSTRWGWTCRFGCPCSIHRIGIFRRKWWKSTTCNSLKSTTRLMQQRVEINVVGTGFNNHVDSINNDVCLFSLPFVLLRHTEFVFVFWFTVSSWALPRRPKLPLMVNSTAWVMTLKDGIS